MSRIFFCAICFFVMSSCGGGNGGTREQSVQSYAGIGVVKAISDSKAHVNIDHEAIDGFMDAMQMFFPVLDSTVLNGVEVSDSIAFEIVVDGGNYAISSIEIFE